MDKLIRIRQVMELTGLAKSTVWAWVKTDKLPQPTKLSTRISVWKESEILDWINKATS